MHTRNYKLFKSAWAFSGMFVILAGSRALADGPFTQGNIVLSVVDTQSATALSGIATRVRLVEYAFNGSGALVATGQNYSLPGKGENGAVRGLTNSGSATSEGRITLSADGRYILAAGYDAAISTAGIAATRASAVNRVIGRIDYTQIAVTAAANLTTALTDAYDGNNIRNAASLDGSSFYTAGTSAPGTLAAPIDQTGVTAGIRYALLGATTSTQVYGNNANVTTQTSNTRTVKITMGRLQIGAGSTPPSTGTPPVFSSATLNGVATFNPGLPTTYQTRTKEVDTSFLAPTATISPSPYDFYFSDPNTCYTTDDRTTATGTATGGLYRFKRDPITGVFSTTPDEHFVLTGLSGGTTSAGLRGLTGTRNASGNVVLYATSTDNRVVSLTDTSSSATFSVILTVSNASPVTLAIRGIVQLQPVTVATLNINGLANAGVSNNGVAPAVTFEYRTPGSTTPLVSVTDVPFPDGRIFIAGSPAGTYDIGIKGFNLLRSTFGSVAMPTGNVTLAPVNLLAGDTNGDNIVDFNDFDNLGGSFFLQNGPFLSGTSDPGFIIGADLNYDGIVDFNDFDLLGTNFFVTGDN